MKQPIFRTLIVLKPDALERGLVGEILHRFENKGLKVVAAEMRSVDDKLAKNHYIEHQHSKAFYNDICNALTRGPVIAMILEGPDVVNASRQLIGFASPVENSQIGTIRADLAIYEPQNLVHGSDSPSAAAREIALWFDKKMAVAKQAPKKIGLGDLGVPKVPKKTAPKNSKAPSEYDEYKPLPKWSSKKKQWDIPWKPIEPDYDIPDELPIDNSEPMISFDEFDKLLNQKKKMVGLLNQIDNAELIDTTTKV